MNLSLRNLFRTRTGRAAAPPSRRPDQTTRLEVEALEERAVPTISLKGYLFPMPNATLTVSNQIGSTFWGTFHDATSGFNVPVSGQLAPLGPPKLDAIHFGGAVSVGFEAEQVVFNGELYEGPPPLMMGQLAEHYTVTLPFLPPLSWTTFERVETYGRWIGTFPLDPIPGAGYASTPQPGGMAMSQAPLDALFSAGHAPLDPVAVNPQPLPPG
jgi:hypothetical protein